MRRLDRSSVEGLVIAGGLLYAAAAIALIFVASTYQGATYRCNVDGPSSPLASLEENSRVEGGFNFWSLGRSCQWERSDGEGTVTVDSGTPGSILVFAIVPAIGVTLSAIGARARRPGR